MKIKKIILENFRQYAGKQTIQFELKNGKNLTVIIGVNGAGKTNLLNAITWCLYGREEHLLPVEPFHEMLNDSLRAKLKPDEIGEVKVELFFQDEQTGDEIRIFRGKKFRKTREGSLTHFSEEWCGWLKPASREDWLEADVAILVNRVLPYGVRNFFFFDGERLINFFEEAAQENVKNAILDVSQISLLEITIRHLSDKRYELLGEVSQLSPKSRELFEKIETLRKSLEVTLEEIKQLETNKNEIEKLLKDVDKKLRGYSEERVRELQERYEIVESEISDLENEKNEMEGLFKKLIIEDGSTFLASEALDFTFEEIKKKYKKGELPPKIKDTFLRELLERGECICGSDISKGEGRKRIEEELATSGIASKLHDVITSMRFELEKLRERKEKFLEEKIKLGKRIKELEEDIKKKKEELEGINIRLKELKIQKVESLAKQREEYTKQKEEIISELSTKKWSQKNLEAQISELEKELKMERKKEEKLDIINKKIDVCEKAISFLEKVKSEILKEIKGNVEKQTAEYFHQLIWKKEKFKTVKIDENYTVQVIDRYDNNIISALSAGEKEILALSFMAALRRVSGFEAPIFIDTPLARISGEHRINIAKCLPKYLEGAQFILLLTDKEYTEDVRKLLKPKVCMEYLLNYDDKKDETKVEKYGR